MPEGRRLISDLDAGQAALPGGEFTPSKGRPTAKKEADKADDASNVTGRADTLEETPFQTARREAREEIGLGDRLPDPFAVEHLCELPASLAKTELVVRPCVALLHSHDKATGMSADPEESLIPRLDAKEVAAVFTAPFHNFLWMRDDPAAGGRPEDWYQGAWTEWHQHNWRSKSVTPVAGPCFHWVAAGLLFLCSGSRLPSTLLDQQDSLTSPF